MLLPFRPMSATERSRQFREQNPGYDARRKRTQRAREKRLTLQMLEAQQAELVAQQAAAARGPLLLPAPVESIELSLMEAMLARREAVRVGVVVDPGR